MPKRLFVFLSSLLVPLLVAIFLIATEPRVEAPIVAAQDVPPVEQATSTAPEAKVQANATVLRTVDGDTFVATLDGEDGEWKIRMLGIDTPETVDPRRPVACFGKEASKKLAELLTGKRVRLESDPQADERDKYDRLLKNVILEDGTDVNALMVREGFAHAYLSFPLNPARKRELKGLEALAKAASAGLWSNNACPVHS